jgi:hypothetical protein
MKSIGLIDEYDRPTKVAKIILDDEGYDPFLEDIGTIWLFHFFLVKSQYASIYDIIFNNFATIKEEFSKERLLNFILKQALSTAKETYNSKTIEKDINVFIRNYLQVDAKSVKNSFEDEFSGLFQELLLLDVQKKKNINNVLVDHFSLKQRQRDSLPIDIFLYAMLVEVAVEDTFSLNELITRRRSLANTFLLSKEGLYKIIEELADKNDFIKVKQSEGSVTIQFLKKPNPLGILKKYYEYRKVYAIN